MKSFNSAKGEGVLFSMDASDEAGSEITISLFNAEATKFFSYLSAGQVYIFKKVFIKASMNPKL